jgi:putative glutathione S-transferase
VSTTPQFGAETDRAGRFVRQQSAFRDQVPARPAPGRYHLYVSLACPWASRIALARRLLGLEDVLGMTVLDPIRDERGWRFTAEDPDPVNGFRYLAEAYRATDPGFQGRVTVPALWDVRDGRIVNNESGDLLRMVDAWAPDGPDLYPRAHRAEIDAINERVYHQVNNGVYRAGFATTQPAYDDAVADVFSGLDWLEERLRTRRYLVGDAPTEADWRLFTTLVRFDAVYAVHFKCNVRRIVDYPALWGYLRDLFQHPGVAETVDFDAIKRHYYVTHRGLNPTGIVPAGPALDLWTPHGREALAADDG